MSRWHAWFIAAAWALFALGLLWDYLAPRWQRRALQREYRLRARRQAQRGAAQ
jgi:hypothetical protein